MNKLLELFKIFGEYTDELIAIGAILAEFKTASTNHERAKIICKAAKVIAGQTETPLDDDAVEIVEAALNCPEIKNAVDKIMADIEKSKAA